MKEKDARIHVRIPADLKDRIANVVDRTGIEEAALVRNCVEAICDHFEATGSITLPMSITTGKAKGCPDVHPRAGRPPTTSSAELTKRVGRGPFGDSVMKP